MGDTFSQMQICQDTTNVVRDQPPQNNMTVRNSKLSQSKQQDDDKRFTLTGDSRIRQDIYTIMKHSNQKHVLNDYLSLTKEEQVKFQGRNLIRKFGIN